MPPKPFVSVVLVVQDNHPLAGDVLAALDLQAPQEGEFECILVDDRSPARAATLVHSQLTFNLTLLCNPMPQGRAISRNRGWQAARGDWIVFLDGDTVPCCGWLAAFRQKFESSPDLVLGGDHISYRDCCSCPLKAPGALPFTSALLTQPYDGSQATKSSPASSPQPDPPADFHHQFHPSAFGYRFKGCNFAITKILLAVLRGFAPFIQGGQDFDFGVRLAELNPTVLSAENAMVCEPRSRHANTMTDGEYCALLYRNPLKSVVMIHHLASTDGVHGKASHAVFANGIDDIVRAELDPAASAWRRLLALATPDLIPGVFACCEDEVIDYFSAAVGIAPLIVSDYLKAAISRGLVVRQTTGRTYFDIFHTGNWLRAKTPYLEHQLRNTGFARSHAALRGGESGGRTLAFRCTGQYAITLNPMAGLPWETAKVNLSTPAEHTCQQNVRLTRFNPPILACHFSEENNLITNVPAVLCAESGGTIGYEFECDVAESSLPCRHDSPEAACNDPARKRAEYLRFTFPASYLERAHSLLSYILRGKQTDAEGDARQIYRWVVENLSYAPTHLPDYSILDAGIGTCTHLTRLFLNLVRLRGVPAREQCGSLMERALSDSKTVTVGSGYSLFSHTWVEIYLEGRGWCGVDFVVMCYGKWQTNRLNVGQELRSEVAIQSEALLDYYFGNIDPYRIYANSCANSISPITISDFPNNAELRKELIFHLHHRLTCSIS